MQGPINIRAVQHAHATFLRQIDRAVDSVARDAAAYGKAHEGHRFKTSSPNGLDASTEAGVRRRAKGLSVFFRNKKKYAWAQEKGSGIHAGKGRYLIRARKAKALRFVSGGAMVFRRAVMHPGVPATHFLFRKTEAAFAHASTLLRLRLERESAKFSKQRV